MRVPMRRSAVLVFAIVCGLFAACGRREGKAAPSEGPQQSRAPAVSEVELGRGVNAARRVRERTDTFTPRDTLWASVRTRNLGPGTRILARWVYTGGGADQIVAEEARTAAEGDGWTGFFASSPEPWPPGTYELRIGMDGEIRTVREFRISS